MDRLHFGARSRRRAQRRHMVIAAWLVGLIAMVYGVPGSDAALLLFRTAGRSRTVSAAGIPIRHPAPARVHVRRGALEPASTLSPKPVRRPQPKAASVPHPRRTPGPSPSPTPSPAGFAAPAGSVTAVIYAAAAESGISGSYLLSLARCESSLNARAYNAAGYYGLFQFDRVTWSAYGSGSIWDAQAQARAAARLIAAGQTHRWPNCP